MKKMKKKVVKIETIEPMFEVGEVVMLKDNLLLVQIGDINIKRHRYIYKVRYCHLYNHASDDVLGWFEVYENDLAERPFNYNDLIFEQYIHYRKKYENLIESLRLGRNFYE